MNATLSTERQGLASGGGHSIWFLFLGLVLLLSGTFALLAPITSTLAVSLVFGFATGISGIAQIIQAFGAKKWRGFFLNLLLGLIYLVCAVVLLSSPFASALAITLILAIFLIITGFGEIFLGLQVRPEGGWGWLVFSGLVAVIGGAWLMFRLPLAGLFVPGIALGFTLIFEGVAFLAIGLKRGRRTDPAIGSAAGAAGGA